MASTAPSPGDWHSPFVNCLNPVHTFKNYSCRLSPVTLFECAICFTSTLTDKLCQHSVLVNQVAAVLAGPLSSRLLTSVSRGGEA